MKWLAIAAVGLALAIVTTMSVVHGPSVQAQQVAEIALPPPGTTKPLFPGCNNISLTFPDGTTSQAVAQAVVPAGTVESLWRHSGALGKFEGFSPVAPQASDLLTVNFLDAVWLCMTTAPGATSPPPAAPTPTPTSPPPPPGGGSWSVVTTDLAVTDIFVKPDTTSWARITNNGPDGLSNVSVDLRCEMEQMELANPQNVQGMVSAWPITINLAPGQTQEFDTRLAKLDFTKYAYRITCNAQVGFNDPNPGNNIHAENLP